MVNVVVLAPECQCYDRLTAMLDEVVEHMVAVRLYSISYNNTDAMVTRYSKERNYDMNQYRSDTEAIDECHVLAVVWHESEHYYDVIQKAKNGGAIILSYII